MPAARFCVPTTEPVPLARVSTWTFVAEPALTVKAALLPAVRVMPLLRVAVRMTPLSAFVYVTPLIVTLPELRAIVPVRVPPRVPVPVLRVRATAVADVTLAALPLASWDWTTTLKAVPAMGLAPPLTEVIASLVGVPATTVKVDDVPAVRVGVPLVWVAVSETPLSAFV